MASEKYQEYLCSREWGLKREAVEQRSGGVCERCKRNPGTAVHHKSYARIYKELLTDLIHLCEGCHAFTHGRSDVDPAIVKLEPVRVYVAGTVCDDDSGQLDCWRDDIFGEGRDSGNAGWQGICGDATRDRSGRFVYGGPQIEAGHGQLDADQLARRCIAQVSLCDVVFVWFSSTKTVGTLVELGAAAALNIPIYVTYAHARLVKHYYFAAQLSHIRPLVARDHVSAWKWFGDMCERGNWEWWQREYSGLNEQRNRELVKFLRESSAAMETNAKLSRIVTP